MPRYSLESEKDLLDFVSEISVMMSLRPQREAWNRLMAAGDSMLATWSGITTDAGQLRRIKDEPVGDAELQLAKLIRERRAEHAMVERKR